MRALVLAAMAACTLAAQVKLPEYTREVLPNGAVIYLLPRPGVPLVHISVAIRGGIESEPSQLAGIAGVTAELLRRGAHKRSADQFSDELDSLGGTYAAGATNEASIVSAEFLKKDLDAGLDLVADSILRPTFPEAEARKLLVRRIDAVRASRDNPNAAISPYWRSYFFGASHPYGRPPSEITLERIRREDIAEYHKRMYTGRNLVVVLTGDFDPATARAKLAAAFGPAPAGTAHAWTREAPRPAASGPRLLLIDKPDATQTNFRIGQPGIARTNPDRVALWLVNTLFGGRFTSMLNDELRVNAGLTYGASSILEQSRLPGGIVISTFTRTGTTGKAIDLALDILKRLRDKGITEGQLASAKAYLQGTYPTRELETIDQLAEKLVEFELFGLGREEVDTLFQRMDAVTLEQANAAIRKYYVAENLTFVLIGNAARIRDSIAKYAPQVDERSIQQPGW